jgi:chromate transport protein ChrA
LKPQSDSELEAACGVGSKGTLPRLVFYFLRLGTWAFGGPIALAARMQKDLVEELDRISEQDYLEGLAFSQLFSAVSR